jgi:hypothetical protein
MCSLLRSKFLFGGVAEYTKEELLLFFQCFWGNTMYVVCFWLFRCSYALVLLGKFTL